MTFQNLIGILLLLAVGFLLLHAMRILKKIFSGGTAGSVLAGRLTENLEFKVLVIEAGPTYVRTDNGY